MMLSHTRKEKTDILARVFQKTLILGINVEISTFIGKCR